jgi:hypothetical protein
MKQECWQCGATNAECREDSGLCPICTLEKQHGANLNRGCARNTPSVQSWLNTCPAVYAWQEHDEEYLDFVYRADIEVPLRHPAVYFDR